MRTAVFAGNCHHRVKDKACKKYKNDGCVSNSYTFAYVGDGYVKLVAYAKTEVYLHGRL